MDKRRVILGGPPASRKLQRAAGLKKYTPLPGSRKGPCGACGQGMWLGPKQIAFVQEHPDEDCVAMCFVCHARMVLATGVKPAEMTLGKEGGKYEWEAPISGKN